MEHGSMLRKLTEMEELLRTDLLAKPDKWKTLDVLYEKPHVERLWQQVGEYRVALHRIHAEGADKALYHPHPWPSAVKILKGSYDMIVGHGKDNPPIAASLYLNQGSSYEMIDPDGWHAVMPREVCYTLLVTGTPWDRPSPGTGIKHPPLSDDVKSEILRVFSYFYRPQSLGRTPSYDHLLD